MCVACTIGELQHHRKERGEPGAQSDEARRALPVAQGGEASKRPTAGLAGSSEKAKSAQLNPKRPHAFGIAGFL